MKLGKVPSKNIDLSQLNPEEIQKVRQAIDLK
jgi:hypothetical protein